MDVATPDAAPAQLLVKITTNINNIISYLEDHNPNPNSSSTLLGAHVRFFLGGLQIHLANYLLERCPFAESMPFQRKLFQLSHNSIRINILWIEYYFG